jgi:hypothetical protein
MNKQLLIEYSAFQPIQQSLTEVRRLANGNMVVSGLVQATDKPNANKRIYPYQTLFVQVQKYIAGPISENRALGELDHPESSIINLKNVSHNIIRLFWEGKDLYGDVEILPTPIKRIIQKQYHCWYFI